MRLSKLQKRIIQVLANRTVNDYCDDWREMFVTYRELLMACQDHWGGEFDFRGDRKRWLTAKASLSRSVRTLYKNGLVTGMALAWVIKTIEDWGECEDILAWQGGGRKRKRVSRDGSVFVDDQPRFKLIGLSHAGWQLAEDLGYIEPTE